MNLRSSSPRAFPLSLILLGLIASPAVSAASPGGPDRMDAGSARAYGQLPLSFTENRGQTDPSVRYVIQGPRASAFFTDNGVTLDLTDGRKGSPERRGSDRLSGQAADLASFTESEQCSALRMTFAGADSDCRVQGMDQLPGKVNILRGSDPSKWRTDIPTFRGVVYRNVWPGIDVSYRGDRQQLKYDIRVNPGSDLSDIRLKYEGAERIWLDRKGDLRVKTAAATFVETVPGIYQEKDGERIALKGGYILLDDQTVGFRVKDADPSLPLTIDPASDLIYSTYLGASKDDIARAIAVDSDGCAYVTGYTSGADFPTTVGAYDRHFGVSDSDYYREDVFVTKLNANGSGLVYSTFLGGSRFDLGYAIAVDSGKRAYVAGYTESSDFPTTPGAADSISNGGQDAFVARLSADGSTLEYSTYLGGDGDDIANGVAVIPGGYAIVAGVTSSSSFPTTPGAFDEAFNGATDAFVTRVDTNGGALSYSTFLGGTGDDNADSVAIDGDGRAYVSGRTGSSGFPTTPSALHGTLAYTHDAFVTKLNSDGSALEYSALMGGCADADIPTNIAIDGAGCAYITGQGWFEATPRSLFPTPDAPCTYVAKLNSSGSSLLYLTYPCGYTRGPCSIAVDPSTGCACLAGTTSGSLRVTPDAYQQTLRYNAQILDDGFVMRLSPNGDNYRYCTYVGGTNLDFLYGIALGQNGQVYVTGSTASVDFPVTTGAYDKTGPGRYDQGGDVFVSKLYADGFAGFPRVLSLSPTSGTYASGAKVALSATYTEPRGYSHMNACSVIVNPKLSGPNSVYLIYSQPDNKLYVMNDAGSAWLGGVTPGTAGATIGNSQCTVYCGETTVVPNGEDLTVNWKFSFKPSMASKTCDAWMRLADKEGFVAGWQDMMASIKIGSSPVNVGASPASGIFGPLQKFVFSASYSDPDGYGDLSACYAIVNPTLTNYASIELIYSQSDNKLYMWDDSAHKWFGGVTPGTAGAVIQNVNCIVYCDETTIDRSGNNLTVNWKIAFRQGEAGRVCSAWLRSVDRFGLVDEWEKMPVSLTVDSLPTNVSVSPTSGTYAPGEKLILATTYYDFDGYMDLSTCYSILNPTLSAANSIELIYHQPTNRLYLQNDAGTAWLGGVKPGEAGATIENSRCIVYCGETTTNRSNNLTVYWKIALKSTMANKTCGAWLRVTDRMGMVDEWEKMPVSISVSGGPPSNVSVSPKSGTYAAGSKLTFSTSYSDPDGYTDLGTCYSILNPTLSAANSVELIYYQPTNKLYLQNDAGNAWLGGVTPGTSGSTIENSRCVVYCGETTTSGSGNNLTVNWKIAPKSPMAGKTCGAWLRVNDRAGLTDEWENMGASIGITSGP